MAILLKACKPDNFELHNSLKHSFTNIWGLHSHFINCESFLESNSPGWLSWFWQFLCERLSSFNLNRFYYSYAWSHSLCEKGLSFAQDLSLENSVDSYICFWLALLHSVSYFFFLYWSRSLSLCMVFDSISSDVDEVLSINYLQMFLSLETLTSIIRTS